MRALLIALALVVGCKHKDKDSATDPTSPPITPNGAWQQTTQFGGKTGPDGILEVEVVVGAGTNAFQVSATSPDDFVGLERVIDPNGDVILNWEDWWNSETALTDAFFGWTRTMAFNWPVRDEDPALIPGTYIVEVYTARANGNYVNGRVDGTVWEKADPDLMAGEVPVHVVWAKNQDTAENQAAADIAVERWREIWAQQGLTLVPTFHTSDLDKNLGFAYNALGSEEVKAVAATLPPGELVLVVGETLDGDADTYGLAGGIPGTLDATAWTWVLVGWLTHAGPNGVFNAEETRQFGETMAHEIGHYTGLYHPVECPYDCENSWDALADTPDCVGWVQCEEQLGSNLMYPYSICDYSTNTCVPAGTMTEDQGAVGNRYLGTK